jgi:hypothetical protein
MVNGIAPQFTPTVPTLEGGPSFLDPRHLIDRSESVNRSEWFWAVLSTFILLVLITTWAGSQAPEIQGIVQGFAALMMLGGATALGVYVMHGARGRAYELRRVESIEELVQLRRWPEAAMALQSLLSTPMRTAQGRVQALVYLGMVLSRYQRYADAMTVHEYLLANVAMDDDAVHALRCGRALAMLHEDRLVDADRAIVELRRDASSETSAGLALVEIYRDVKTGHPAEAIEMFRTRLPHLRRQLGHRVADAWALVARAYDMVGQTPLAAEAYFNSTALAPIGETSAKYAEVAALTGRYQPAAAPTE